MTIIDLHPEDLLEKHALGVLSADETARLSLHLAHCSACRFELLVRDDFGQELGETDARPSVVLGLVQQALARQNSSSGAGAGVEEEDPSSSASCSASGSLGSLEAVEESHASNRDLGVAISLHDASSSTELRRRRRSVRAMVWFFAAAGVLACGVAGATGLTQRVWLRVVEQFAGASGEGANVPPLDTPQGERAKRGAFARVRAQGPAEAQANSETAPVSEDLDTAPNETVSAEVEASAEPGGDKLQHAISSKITAPASAKSATREPSQVATAEALFDEANRARRTGDLAVALLKYEALERAFPSSRQARIAQATTAKLLLDSGDFRAAVARFDAYLASGAVDLREEAMAGRATALERLGDRSVETQAWSALLQAYPASPYAEHARRRVASLSGL